MAEYQLVMRVGPSPGKTYPLTLNEIIIGRDISCDIVINDAEISRNHCKLVLQGDSYWVEDLGSTNGTHVDDRRVSGQHPLKPGELVRFGDNVTLAFEAVGVKYNFSAFQTITHLVAHNNYGQRYMLPALPIHYPARHHRLTLCTSRWYWLGLAETKDCLRPQ